jgi:hypothetical protein
MTAAPLRAEAVALEVAALRAEVVALRRDVATLRGELGELRALVAGRLRPLAERDRERMELLLPEIFATLGESAWTAADLLETSLLPAHAGLAAALAAAGTGTGSLRALGRLLTRSCGHCADGFRLRRVGTDRAGVVYVVDRVSRY